MKPENTMKKGSERGQVTVFIIIALIIVLAVLVYLFYPEIKSTISGEKEDPASFIQNCLEEDVLALSETISLHGGSISPGHYILYQGEKVEYLCYSQNYHEACTMQQPLLDNHIEREIKTSITEKVGKCFSDLRSSYEKQGYTVRLANDDFSVELMPKRIVLNFNSSLTLTKSETQNYDSFRVIVNNNLYELVSITDSILNWETKYGDAETTVYMDAYKDLKVEKKKQSEGSTIYVLTDRNNGNKFQFASRSFAWPPGFS